MPQSAEEFGDPLSAPFWRAARDRRLVLQRCPACGRHELYPRPFCLACQDDALAWVEASGLGSVYSRSKVWRTVSPTESAPFVGAIVELDEGPRLMTVLVNGDAVIGDRVRVAWRERGALPPLPVFEPAPEKTK